MGVNSLLIWRNWDAIFYTYIIPVLVPVSRNWSGSISPMMSRISYWICISWIRCINYIYYVCHYFMYRWMNYVLNYFVCVWIIAIISKIKIRKCACCLKKLS
jgi:hypothetical protein